MMKTYTFKDTRWLERLPVLNFTPEAAAELVLWEIISNDVEENDQFLVTPQKSSDSF